VESLKECFVSLKEVRDFVTSFVFGDKAGRSNQAAYIALHVA
jgi:hypothetical protein